MGDAKTVLRLVEEHIPPDQKDIRGTTPLWQAAARGHKDVVQVLLATKVVNVNAKSIAQRTPIFWAAANGHIEVVRLLLDHGARHDYKDADGQSPLEISQARRQRELADVLIEDNVKESAV
jgi:ankyrin repeat protein